MRFQTNDTVDTADEDLVLTLLERNLLCISLRVDRFRDELRAYGIGPSPRPINAQNTSIFRVEAERDGRILLTGDIEFQASALMDGSAQEPAVRSKIENAVRLTKAEVAMSQIAAGVRAPAAAAPVLVMAAPELAPGNSPALKTAHAGTERGGLRQHDQSSAADRRDLAPGERTVADQSCGGRIGGIQSRPVAMPGLPQNRADYTDRIARQYPRLIAASAALLLLVATYLFGRLQGRGAAEVASDPGRVTEAVRSQVPPPEEQLHYDGPAVSAMAASATARSGQAIPTSSQPSGALAAKAHAQGRTAQTLAQRSVTPAPLAQGKPQIAPATPVASTVPSGQTPTSRAGDIALAVQPATLPAAEARPVPNDAALGDRLEQWAASMRSTDAAQQASFYADHMDRYFLKTDVSHDFVLRDKAEFLRRGKRVERFDLEDVAVRDRTDSAARIRLVKHYVVQDGRAGPASEKLVRSELSLRKVEGAWEITGERDFK